MTALHSHSGKLKVTVNDGADNSLIEAGEDCGCRLSTGESAEIAPLYEPISRVDLTAVVREVDKSVNIQQGQRIVTGNLTNGVVPNLLIGYVYSVKKEAISDTQEIELVPYANFDKLRTVSVVRGKKPQP